MEKSKKEISQRLLETIKIIKEVRPNVTQLEIHKLLYIAYCIYLKKYNGKELFKENFEAWIYGPVIREIYYHPEKNDRYNTKYIDKYINKLEIKSIEKNEEEFIKSKLQEIISETDNVFDWIKWTHNDDCWNKKNLLQKITKKSIKKHHIDENAKLGWDEIIKYDN